MCQVLNTSLRTPGLYCRVMPLTKKIQPSLFLNYYILNKIIPSSKNSPLLCGGNNELHLPRTKKMTAGNIFYH